MVAFGTHSPQAAAPRLSVRTRTLLLASLLAVQHAGSAATAAPPVAPASTPANAVDNKSKGKPAVPQAETTAPLPAPIAAMLRRGQNVRLVDTFLVSPELAAYVLTAGEERRIYYVPKGSSYAILGLLFDANLDNVTTEHLKRYPAPVAKTAAAAAAVAPAAAPAAALPAASRAGGPGLESALPPAAAATLVSQMQSLVAANQGANVFSEGNGPDVYIFFDLACPYCHQLYAATRNMVGKYRLHWIPLAALGPRSLLLTETFLTAPDKGAALALAVKNQLPAPMQIASPATLAAVKAHGNVFTEAGFKQVPVIAMPAGPSRGLVIVGVQDPSLMEQTFAYAAAGSGQAGR